MLNTCPEMTNTPRQTPWSREPMLLTCSYSTAVSEWIFLSRSLTRGRASADIWLHTSFVIFQACSNFTGNDCSCPFCNWKLIVGRYFELKNTSMLLSMYCKMCEIWSLCINKISFKKRKTISSFLIISTDELCLN